uniref:Uncharacterized protein n=1 Tax=Dulem virus 36 TaxID=3145754 RepID=A0AAU8B221_9CAUD
MEYNKELREQLLEESGIILSKGERRRVMEISSKDFAYWCKRSGVDLHAEKSEWDLVIEAVAKWRSKKAMLSLVCSLEEGTVGSGILDMMSGTQSENKTSDVREEAARIRKEMNELAEFIKPKCGSTDFTDVYFV